MFLSNVLVGWAALEVARTVGRRERERVEGPKPVLSETEGVVAEAHH
jgi:hypothetical protein